MIENTITALKNKQYHKLIIGAALKEFSTIENFAYLFTHAGANVIDISAFPLSVISAKRGIKKALEEDESLEEPLIMVSINIGEDPHFRRVEVDNYKCTECMQCIPSCPSKAFLDFNALDENADTMKNIFQVKGDFGYNEDLCFGCSHCLSYCNFDALSFINWSAFEGDSLQALIEKGANAIEIHLNNDVKAFEDFYNALPILPDDFLQSFSIGSELMTGDDLRLATSTIIDKVHSKYGKDKVIIIQTDGIPMSGARNLQLTKEKDQISIENAELVSEYIKERYPESVRKNIYIQIAGGISENSLSKAFERRVDINGVAIGSYARKQILDSLGQNSINHLHEDSNLTQKLKQKAKELITQSKSLAGVTNLKIEV